jgi:hypothetical protein
LLVNKNDEILWVLGLQKKELKTIKDYDECIQIDVL